MVNPGVDITTTNVVKDESEVLTLGEVLFETIAALIHGAKCQDARNPGPTFNLSNVLLSKSSAAKAVKQSFYLLSAANALPVAVVCQQLQFQASKTMDGLSDDLSFCHLTPRLFGAVDGDSSVMLPDRDDSPCRQLVVSTSCDSGEVGNSSESGDSVNGDSATG